jgi:hypothetical protein
VLEHVEHKDVVLALFGASSAMAGLVLVFLGFVVSALQPFSPLTSANVLRPYQIAASGLFGAFLLGIASVVLAVWWLTGSQSSVPYQGIVLTFVLQLIVLVAVAVWTLWKLVFRK